MSYFTGMDAFYDIAAFYSAAGLTQYGVRKDGSLPGLSPESAFRQRRLLEAEGITFDEKGRVNHRHFEEDAP